jgi:hypothetical protein
MTGFDILFAAAGNLYLLLMLMSICAVLWVGKTLARKLSSATPVLVVFIAPITPEIYRTVEYRSKLARAQALFEKRCKTAGEKIYKTVEDVEGVLLINPRPQQVQGRDEADQNWIGAGLPTEATGNQYIMNFLFYGVAESGNTIRSLNSGGTAGPSGSIAAGVAPEGTRGYRYVDIEENGIRSRYSLRPLRSYTSNGDPLEAYGKREVATYSPPLYSVTYENIVDPEGRANWIAGARVKVVDQKSGELLGERTQFSFEAGLGSKEGFRQPWILARQCPFENSSATNAGTVRFFVEKILKPAQEK